MEIPDSFCHLLWYKSFLFEIEKEGRIAWTFDLYYELFLALKY